MISPSDTAPYLPFGGRDCSAAVHFNPPGIPIADSARLLTGNASKSKVEFGFGLPLPARPQVAGRLVDLVA